MLGPKINPNSEFAAQAIKLMPLASTLYMTSRGEARARRWAFTFADFMNKAKLEAIYRETLMTFRIPVSRFSNAEDGHEEQRAAIWRAVNFLNLYVHAGSVAEAAAALTVASVAVTDAAAGLGLKVTLDLGRRTRSLAKAIEKELPNLPFQSSEWRRIEPSLN